MTLRSLIMPEIACIALDHSIYLIHLDPKTFSYVVAIRLIVLGILGLIR